MLGEVDMATMLWLHVDMNARRSKDAMQISEVAEGFSVAPHVLRHWEDVGLLRPQRNPAGERRYRRVDRIRIAAILRAKAAGLALSDIRDLLADTEPATRARLLAHHRDRLRVRLDQTQASLDMIAAVLNCRHGDVATCPHFQKLLDDDLASSIIQVDEG